MSWRAHMPRKPVAAERCSLVCFGGMEKLLHDLTCDGCGGHVQSGACTECGKPKHVVPYAAACGTGHLRLPNDADVAHEARARAVKRPRKGSETVVWKRIVAKDGTERSVPRLNGSSRSAWASADAEAAVPRRAQLHARLTAQLMKHSSEQNSAAALSARFSLMLLQRGDYAGGMCKSASSCKTDGNVFKYPRYMKQFVFAGVAKKEGDFCDANRPAALKFARQHALQKAPTHKVSGRPWDELTHSKRAALVQRLCTSVMHGFDDFAACLQAERETRHAASARLGDGARAH